MATSELQTVIAGWRRLIADLKEENVKLDSARQLLSAKDDELKQATKEWEETKAETQDAVTKVTTEITSSRSEVAALEAQTESLKNRIEQRQQKTANYEEIILAKSSEVESAKSRVYEAEEGVRQRLATFMAARQDLRSELESKITKIGVLEENERNETDSKVSALEKKIKGLKAVITGEQSRWNAEKDRRDKEDKVHCLLSLRAEIDASNKSKVRETNFLRDSTILKANIDHAVNEIESLLGELSLDHPRDSEIAEA